MQCQNKKSTAQHSGLCNISELYKQTSSQPQVRATNASDCTLGSKVTSEQSLSPENNMHQLSLDAFDQFVDAQTVFGTYFSGLPSKGVHVCVDAGRRTVNGLRLSWLWVYPGGRVGPSNKKIGALPTATWTKQDIILAHETCNKTTLPLWTRHAETYSELAISVCLPFPPNANAGCCTIL